METDGDHFLIKVGLKAQQTEEKKSRILWKPGNYVMVGRQ